MESQKRVRDTLLFIMKTFVQLTDLACSEEAEAKVWILGWK